MFYLRYHTFASKFWFWIFLLLSSTPISKCLYSQRILKIANMKRCWNLKYNNFSCVFIVLPFFLIFISFISLSCPSLSVKTANYVNIYV
jgi:hypothetical protein